MSHKLHIVPQFERMSWIEDYCKVYYGFRRLNRAFMGPPAEEEAQLRKRLDEFNKQFGGKPCFEKVFDSKDPSKKKVDAFLAAFDLLDALAPISWRDNMNRTVTADSLITFRLAGLIAWNFERFSLGEIIEKDANRKISGHLFALARQFPADVHA